MHKDFREFFKGHTFILVASGDSNWDYYHMTYNANDEGCIVSLAKENSECADSFFGSMAYFNAYLRSNPLELTDYGKNLYKKADVA